eukprot:1196289-Prorocentrum_minimum.AAC.3
MVLGAVLVEEGIREVPACLPAASGCRHTCEGERRASSGVRLLQPGPILWERICTPTRPVYPKAGLVAPVLVVAVGALPLRMAPARNVRGRVFRGYLQHQQPMYVGRPVSAPWHTTPLRLACAVVSGRCGSTAGRGSPSGRQVRKGAQVRRRRGRPSRLQQCPQPRCRRLASM